MNLLLNKAEDSELPLVSVIIPAYNSGSFIRYAIESLFRQTYPEEGTEIIVVDDGSTDNTPEILKEYMAKISYLRQVNKGIAGARNRGISMAKGEIITFLDADDIWHTERLERVVNTFREKPDIEMVYHSVELIDSDGATIHNNFYKAYGYKEGISGWVSNGIFSGKIFCGGSSFAFTKKIVDRVYPIPEDIRRGVDYYMAAVSSCLAPAKYIPYLLGKYRLHGSNTTMTAGQNDYKELALVNKDFAHMRQRVIEKISGLNTLSNSMDIDIIRRIQAKETIFYHVLNGKRLKGIKHIPSLFKGIISTPDPDLFKNIATSFMALFIPSFLYPKLVKAYGFLKRQKIISF